MTSALWKSFWRAELAKRRALGLSWDEMKRRARERAAER